MARAGGQLAAALALAARSASAHSWVACTDYRGGVNYFDQEACLAWPRGYQPTPEEGGYQISEPETRASQNDGCDRPMAAPSWKNAYTADYPHAIYEAGRVYCLAWPMKNHATAAPSCANPHAKSDAGTSESVTLRVSRVNPASDPSQAQFDQRNINELAGLATGCSHQWGELGEAGHNELTDACQLGLERHRDGELDCKGFQRSPKFCDDTGRAMGTGCFKVPANFTPGHYVAQWQWDATFTGRGHFAYRTCFDFEVVQLGSDEARPGLPGTVGKADSSQLPCTNNMEKFAATAARVPRQPEPSSTSPPAAAAQTTSAPSDAPQAPAPPAAPPTGAPASACAGPWGTCAGPAGWTGPMCCVEGYACTPWNSHWSQCLPAEEALALGPTPVPALGQVPGAPAVPALPVARSTPSPSTTPSAACVAPYEHCATPHGGQQCCQSGSSCVFANEHWASCLPDGASLAEIQRHAEAPSPNRHQAMRSQRQHHHAFLSTGPAMVQVGGVLALGKGTGAEAEL